MPVGRRRRRGVAVPAVAAVVVDAQVGRGIGLGVGAGPRRGQEREEEAERMKFKLDVGWSMIHLSNFERSGERASLEDNLMLRGSNLSSGEPKERFGGSLGSS